MRPYTKLKALLLVCFWYTGSQLVSYCRQLSSILLCPLALCAVAFAQSPSLDVAADTAAPGTINCNPWKTQIFPATLTFGNRSCLALSEILSPGVAAQSALFAGFSQWRNSPHMRQSDTDDLAIRFEHLYARRSARITGETLVGYLHHEDPRPRFSGKQGVWHRAGFALLTVLESPDQDGNARIAFAPLAGSLGSGLTSMALYQRQTGIGYGLERSGIVYSHYFIRALFHEFSPDLWSIAPRFVRKYRPVTIPIDQP